MTPQCTPAQKAPDAAHPLDLLNWKQVAGLCFAAMAMLYAAFEPVACWPLAWIAPGVWACGVIFARSTKAALLLGGLSWVAFWLVSVWWLILPTGVGYGFAAFHQSLGPLALAWALRRVARGPVPMTLALPILWCAMELFRGAGPLSFEWFFLAHSQWQQLWLIQIVEFTGPLGLSFVVAAASGLLVDWVRTKVLAAPKRPAVISTAVTALAIVVLLCFGRGAANYSPVEGGLVGIGVVQDVFPLSLSQPSATPDQYLDRHIVLTLDLLPDRPDVVVWPETMIPPGLNREAATFDPARASDAEVRCFARKIIRDLKWPIEKTREVMTRVVGPQPMAAYRCAATEVFLFRHLKPEQINALSPRAASTLWSFLQRPIWSTETSAIKAELRSLSTIKTAAAHYAMETNFSLVFETIKGRAALMQVLAVAMDCPVLAGGSTWHRNPTPLDQDDLWIYRNGVIEFTPDGDWGWHYAKRALVPFSESVPGKYSFTSLWRLMRKAVPPSMVQIEPGPSDTPYLLRKPDDIPAVAELHTPVCFEGTFARRCRELLLAGKPGQGKILINLSNDGWFVYTASPESQKQTPEHMLHFTQAVFRAVETRTPVVRAVNTGISGWVDPGGNVRKMMKNPAAAGRKNTIAPFRAVFHVAPGGTTTLYLRWGEWFALAVTGGCLLLALIPVLLSRNSRN